MGFFWSKTRLTCVIYSYCTKNNETTTFNNIIGYLCIFPFISPRVIFSINRLTLILKIIGWCDVHYDVTDKNNNANFEGIDKHYH